MCSYSFETTWEWINVDNFHFWSNYPLTQQPKSNQTCTWICCSDAWCTAAASWGEICVDVTCTCSEVKQKSDHKSLLFKSQLKWQRKWFFSYRTCQLQQWARHLCAVRVDAVAPLLVHHSGGGATGLLTELLQNLRAFRGQRLQKLFHAVLRYSACLLPHILSRTRSHRLQWAHSWQVNPPCTGALNKNDMNTITVNIWHKPNACFSWHLKFKLNAYAKISYGPFSHFWGPQKSYRWWTETTINHFCIPACSDITRIYPQ